VLHQKAAYICADLSSRPQLFPCSRTADHTYSATCRDDGIGSVNALVSSRQLRNEKPGQSRDGCLVRAGYSVRKENRKAGAAFAGTHTAAQTDRAAQPIDDSSSHP
jgi:hypothetical protein